MSRLLPNREDRARWGPLDWMAYLGGVTGLVSFLGVSAAWIWDNVRELAPDGPAAAIAAPTGRLGLMVEQAGTTVAAEPERVGGRYYSARFQLRPGPFRISVPRRHCGEEGGEEGGDVVTGGVMIRIAPETRLDRIIAELDGPDGREMDTHFCPGCGMAAALFAQTELWAQEPPEYDDMRPFNYLVEQRFQDIGEDRVWVAVNSVRNLVDDRDWLAAAEPFLMLIGVRGALCHEMDAPPIELVSIRFD